MSTPVLDARGLAYAYPDGHQALCGVDLHVHAGERVALLGPNGAGKTTLVLHLNGSCTPAPIRCGLRPSGGQGEPRRGGGGARGDRVPGPRRPAVHGLGARRRGVRAGQPGLRGAALEARVMDALDKVGMADFADRPPHHLSFGQRMVAVAIVLAMELEILALDEPSSNPTRPRAVSSPTSCGRSTTC